MIENPIVQAIHTTVKGRARYKVNGLYQQEGLKRYLEMQLPKLEGIAKVSANQYTGNILVIFNPNKNTSIIASLIREIVLDYRQKNRIPNLKTTPIPKVEKPINSQIKPFTATISTLVLATAVIYKLNLDTNILLAIQKLHSPLLNRIMLGITFLGEAEVLLLICILLAKRLLNRKRNQEAIALAISAGGVVLFNTLLKALFVRPRPALWEHMTHVTFYSFPSGHAMVSTTIYSFIGYLLAQEFPEYQREIYALTFALITAIGFSRLYLGVHWPTDVLAGFAFGLALLAAKQPQIIKSFPNSQLLTPNS